MTIPNRVYFNKETGKVIFQTGEILTGGIPRDMTEAIDWVDISVGLVNYSTSYISLIDPTTKAPVVSHYELSDTDKRIKELEDALLLQADSETGGIL